MEIFTSTETMHMQYIEYVIFLRCKLQLKKQSQTKSMVLSSLWVVLKTQGL